jgi:hypothetical protein
MEKNKKVFEGYNKERLEANIEEFKKEIGNLFIDSYISSHMPQWVIIVEFWDNKKNRKLNHGISH